MILNRIVIENYKSFENFELEFSDDVNVIVGDNETGKSSILEAINLALNGHVHGRSILHELTPFFFNTTKIRMFLDAIRAGLTPKPEAPQILIEVYFRSDKNFARFEGTNNSKRENVPGVKFTITLNDEFTEEYLEYISENPGELKTIPIEYYCIDWYSFAGDRIGPRALPINVSLIDASNIRGDRSADGYVSDIVSNILTPKECAQLKIQHRKLKEDFENEKSVKEINVRLRSLTSEITDKEFTYSVDISSRSSWESNLSTYLDGVPFRFIGKGEQTAIKTKLALNKNTNGKACLVLIEEPENHLSFSSMNKLIRKVQDICDERQLIITTHSSFVLNKLGLEKLILINGTKQTATLKDLTIDTQKYFKNLPGYDTLRLVLAKKTFLVEGPSDELIVQKAYANQHGRLPIEDGIDVFSLRGLSAKRFLEIAKLLKLKVVVFADNDRDCTQLQAKYKDFENCDFIEICFDTDIAYPSLEPQIVKSNLGDLSPLITALGKQKADGSIPSESELIEYMSASARKTDCALKIFESNEPVVLPKYIADAVK